MHGVMFDSYKCDLQCFQVISRKRRRRQKNRQSRKGSVFLRGLYWQYLNAWGKTQIQTTSACTNLRKHSVAQRVALILQDVHTALDMSKEQEYERNQEH